MPKLRVLSGADVIDIFKLFDFAVAGQRGSHIKLQRIINNNVRQTLTVPLHADMDKGTLKAIYNQALPYIPEADLRKYFYTE